VLPLTITTTSSFCDLESQNTSASLKNLIDQGALQHSSRVETADVADGTLDFAAKPPTSALKSTEDEDDNDSGNVVLPLSINTTMSRFCNPATTNTSSHKALENLDYDSSICPLDILPKMCNNVKQYLKFQTNDEHAWQMHFILTDKRSVKRCVNSANRCFNKKIPLQFVDITDNGEKVMYGFSKGKHPFCPSASKIDPALSLKIATIYTAPKDLILGLSPTLNPDGTSRLDENNEPLYKFKQNARQHNPIENQKHFAMYLSTLVHFPTNQMVTSVWPKLQKCHGLAPVEPLEAQQ
jgi:hypothetical protein